MAPDTSDRENLLHTITSRIRQSLELPEILDTATLEIQKFLRADRVKIYQFSEDGSGAVVAESIQGDRLPSLLHLHFPAADIPSEARQHFIQRRQRVIVDVAAQLKTTHGISDSDPTHHRLRPDVRYNTVDPCHLEYLKTMGVQSSVVFPILHQEKLWGLLAIHNRDSRHFSDSDLQIVHLLADQISIAIAQASLLVEARHHAFQEQTLNQISQLLHCPLPLGRVYQLVLEAAVKALEGVGGRLYITPASTEATAQIYVDGVQPDLENLELHDQWETLINRVRVSSQKQDNLNRATLTWQQQSQVFLHPDNAQSTTPENITRVHPHFFTLEMLEANPQYQKLAAMFRQSSIRSILLIPLEFQGTFVGCLTIFRNGYDLEVRWAGKHIADARHAHPRRSFEEWLEVRQDLAPAWSPEDLWLAQSIGMHVYMALMQRRVESMMRYQASHDPLTALPNRVLFAEQVALALADAYYCDEMVGVAFLDLDRFKTINDTLGHTIGDELLRQVAVRLHKCLREGDSLARWGGDEFTLLLPHLKSAEDIGPIAKQLLAALSEPFFLDAQEFYITASLGLALSPYDGEDVGTLLKHADAAMHQAKRQGKNTFQLYFEEINSRALEYLALERDLHRALERQEFVLHYQPQVNLRTYEVVGVEALLRWNHPQLGQIAPGQFIPLAEETELICPIGEWVLREACYQQRRWQRLGLPPIHIAVNLSANQFKQPDLVHQILLILEETGIDPNYLEIEITESAAMQNVESTIMTLNQLRDVGIQIAMDDFGTGYSSLNAIKHFPLNTLKIDQSFVREVCQDPNDAAIARTVIALGQGLGLQTLAEGVECKDQLRFLRMLGCDRAQGHLFSKSMSPSEFATLMLNRVSFFSCQSIQPHKQFRSG
ncbi:bifunctional diguanylate cyclase/phosphodiesterase [Vacuolonema iberomarrocanum]|uniref:bifunctional diguanylate cyclase/phosphodiesterase n=1 Tax=Vacuolonema iberomarrocanum TaxID=3454632 RepID=UPI003F6DB8FA